MGIFTVSIKSDRGTSSVPVAKLSDLDQSISFGFQLHQIASCKHYIVVADSEGESIATFIRKDSITFPSPSKAVEFIS